MLEVELKKLGSSLSFKGEADGKYDKTNDSKLNEMHLKIYADVVPKEGIPNTVDKAIKFISELPTLLKNENDGKGKPLNYVMIPISTFKKLCNFENNINTLIKSIDETFTIEIVCFFEKLASLKQKLNDLKSDISSHQKYLPSDHLKEIHNMQEDIRTNECKLKTIMAENLAKIRAGKIPMKDLVKKLTKLKTDGLNLFKIEMFIDKFNDIRLKINKIDGYLSKNINYLGKDEDLNSLTIGNTKDNFYVLYTSKELNENDIELSKKTLHFFLSEVKSSKINTKYVIADLDLNTKLKDDVNKIKIVHYSDCRIVSHDVYKDYEEESAMNFAKLAQSTAMELVDRKPPNRVPLELPCPGFQLSTCSDDPLLWTCNNCKEYLEYGFDEKYFYCGCGKAPIQSYELKCNAPTHGGVYFPISCHTSLKKELEKLEPLKEMNILILGQSGVGKSTWINSIVNYLWYDTFEDAEKGGVVCVIPSKFTISYLTEKEKGVQSQEVEIGKADANENTQAGKSATQMPKTYNFILSDRAVRLIDTPGLGDTEGIERDKENMKYILDHISHLKEIHGICILMKPNERRMDATFKFCITELLIHLHKNAARNILFCFTNSRSSNYAPGDTTTVLKELLEALKLNDSIQLGKETIFCLDNEAFRFLCTLKYPNISFTAEEHKQYAASWAKSVAETKRLFEQIKDLQPHPVADTTTLCNTRNRILNLTKPIADISKLIQQNVTFMEGEERKINNSELDIKELCKNLFIPHIELEIEPLDYPRTVCTSSTCVENHKSETTDITYVEYKKICHDKCQIQNITTDAYPQRGLMYCDAMDWWFFSWLTNNSPCKVCGCNWDKHMHITYNQKQVEKNIVNNDVKRELNQKKDFKSQLEEHRKELEKKIQKYKNEQKTITYISSKFGLFLKQNAIAPYNDGFKDYLKLLIKNEENKPERSVTDDNLLNNLNKMMVGYEKEVEILKKNMENETDSQNVTTEDIAQLEEKLYELELTGQQIKNIVKIANICNTKALEYAEQSLSIKSGSKWFFWKKKEAIM